MAESAPRKQRMDLAFAALLSNDDQAALSALTRIEQQGDARAIAPLLSALARTPSPVLAQRITALLYQVKTPDAAAALMAALDDPALKAVRKTALAAFWNAGIDAREHLARFTDIAIEGDAEECFECLTIIEHQEVWPEKAARLSLGRLSAAAEREGDAYKQAMLRDAAEALRHRLHPAGK